MKTWQVNAIKQINSAAAKLKKQIAENEFYDWKDVHIEITAECSKTEKLHNQFYKICRTSTRLFAQS